MSYNVSITAKAWDYDSNEKDIAYTGNYRIVAPKREQTEHEKVRTFFDDEPFNNVITFELVRICQIKKALTELNDDPKCTFEATDSQIEELWNQTIRTHNKNTELYIKKFSVEHKDYYVNLTKGYGNFFFTKEMIIENREKAVRINHPIVGKQWIPKKCIIEYFRRPDKSDYYKKYLEFLALNNKTSEEYYVTAYSHNSFINL